jgi:hypothetical protein
MAFHEGRDAALELVLEAGLEFTVSDGVVKEVRHVLHALGELLVPVVEGAHLGDDLVGRIVGGVVAVFVEEGDEVRGRGWERSWGCGRCGYPRVT